MLAPVTSGVLGYPLPMPRMPATWVTIVIAGLLVGFGARLGGGCTSGHGVCGIARISTRSIVATAIFMGAAMVSLPSCVWLWKLIMLALASFVCGLIFGFGLLISGMTQPSKVLGFLDIFGRWDPTLAFVMAAALMVSGVGFALVRQRRRPVLATQHLWPTRTDIDQPLVVGSVLFGIGWGLVGLCPGPALVNLAGLWPSVIVFGLAMSAGMIIKDLWDRRVLSATIVGDSLLSTSTDG